MNSSNDYNWTNEDLQIMKSAFSRWEEIIISHPTGKTIDIDLDVQTLEPETVLGQAYISNSELIDPTLGEVYGNRATLAGGFTINYTSVISMKNTVYTSGLSKLYYITLHEIGHILGIGSMWGMTNAYGYVPSVDPTRTNRFYMAENAVREYRKYFSQYNSLYYIPIEDDGTPGTANVHHEEGDYYPHSSNDRTLNGIFYPGMDIELMTGWANETDLPLSRITIGYVDDINYVVDYSKADDYKGYTSSYLNDHITTAEYWNGVYNLDLTPTSAGKNFSLINTGHFTTLLGTYEIRKTHNDELNDNVEFNHELNSNNSPVFISRSNNDYNISTSENSNTFGSIIISTDVYNVARYKMVCIISTTTNI